MKIKAEGQMYGSLAEKLKTGWVLLAGSISLCVFLLVCKWNNRRERRLCSAPYRLKSNCP
jgi:hypothetical protein